jgi:hypothetical protein
MEMTVSVKSSSRVLQDITDDQTWTRRVRTWPSRERQSELTEANEQAEPPLITAGDDGFLEAE